MAGDVLYLVVGEVYYSGGKEIISRNLIFARKNHPEVFLNIFAGFVEHCMVGSVVLSVSLGLI